MLYRLRSEIKWLKSSSQGKHYGRWVHWCNLFKNNNSGFCQVESNALWDLHRKRLEKQKYEATFVTSNGDCIELLF